jgi:hypothetical protein
MKNMDVNYRIENLIVCAIIIAVLLLQVVYSNALSVKYFVPSRPKSATPIKKFLLARLMLGKGGRLIHKILVY